MEDAGRVGDRTAAASGRGNGTLRHAKRCDPFYTGRLSYAYAEAKGW
ncbi:MAG TPA: hypothetical protein VF303_03505 [Candidatus Nanoarchaeia archaeon]